MKTKRIHYKQTCFTRNTKGNLLDQKGIILDSSLFLSAHSMHQKARPISFISKINLNPFIFSIFHCHHVSKSPEFSFGLLHTLNGFPAYTHPPTPRLAHFPTTRVFKNNWITVFHLKHFNWLSIHLEQDPYYLPWLNKPYKNFSLPELFSYHSLPLL